MTGIILSLLLQGLRHNFTILLEVLDPSNLSKVTENIHFIIFPSLAASHQLSDCHCLI